MAKKKHIAFHNDALVKQLEEHAARNRRDFSGTVEHLCGVALAMEAEPKPETSKRVRRGGARG